MNQKSSERREDKKTSGWGLTGFPDVEKERQTLDQFLTNLRVGGEEESSKWEKFPWVFGVNHPKFFETATYIIYQIFGPSYIIPPTKKRDSARAPVSRCSHWHVRSRVVSRVGSKHGVQGRRDPSLWTRDYWVQGLLGCAMKIRAEKM